MSEHSLGYERYREVDEHIVTIDGVEEAIVDHMFQVYDEVRRQHGRKNFKSLLRSSQALSWPSIYYPHESLQKDEEVEAWIEGKKASRSLTELYTRIVTAGSRDPKTEPLLRASANRFDKLSYHNVPSQGVVTEVDIDYLPRDEHLRLALNLAGTVSKVRTAVLWPDRVPVKA